MNIRKTLLWVLVVAIAALGLTLTGCEKIAHPTGDHPATEAEPVEHPAAEEAAEAADTTEEVVEEAAAEHPASEHPTEHPE